ncbi:MAG: hypothetical protein WCP39_05735 [Chlamydiota bacterium]
MFIIYLSILLILFGWVYQLYFTYKKKKEIQNGFLIAYGIGLILMIMNDVVHSLSFGTLLAVLNLIAVGLILFYKKK